MYDAAFGPMPGMSGGLALSEAASADPMVKELQQLLTQLGYDPGGVTGIRGKRTDGALTALWMALGRQGKPELNAALLDELKGLVKRAELQQKPQVPAVSLAERVPEPFWKSKTFLGLAAAAAAGALYLYLRPSEAQPAPVGDPAPKRKRKVKPLSDLLDEGESKAKCSRTPTVDFDAGEVIEGEVVKVEPSETTTTPSV